MRITGRKATTALSRSRLGKAFSVSRARQQAVVAALFAVAAFGAKVPGTPISVLSDLSGALSNNNISVALTAFDSKMPNYGTIEQNLEAIAQQDDVTSAIEIVSDDEAAGVHKLDLDWILQLTARADAAQLDRRRVRVHVEMRQIKGKWKITALEPVSLFDPLQMK